MKGKVKLGGLLSNLDEPLKPYHLRLSLKKDPPRPLSDTDMKKMLSDAVVNHPEAGEEIKQMLAYFIDIAPYMSSLSVLYCFHRLLQWAHVWRTSHKTFTNLYMSVAASSSLAHIHLAILLRVRLCVREKERERQRETERERERDRESVCV